MEGADTENMEGAAYWLVLLLMLSLLSYTDLVHLPRGEATPSGLGPSISISFLDNAHQTLPTGNSDEGSSSVEVLCSQLCQVDNQD